MLADLVKETTATTGTGTITLSGAVSGFRTFDDAEAAGDLVDGCMVTYAIADSGSYATYRGVWDKTAGTLTRELVSGEVQDLSGSAVVSIVALAKDMDQSYVDLAVVDGQVAPDLAKGRNFLVALELGSFTVVRFPANASAGDRFSITLDATAGFEGNVLWYHEYLMPEHELGLPPILTGYRSRFGFAVDDLGQAVLVEMRPLLVPMSLAKPVGRFIGLMLFGHDPSNLDATDLISEVKFGVAGGGVAPPNLTANTDGAYAVWRVTWPASYPVFDQVGDVYHVSDGNAGTGFGAYQEYPEAWAVVFDLGEVVELASVTVTLSRSGLFGLSTFAVDGDLRPMEEVFDAKETTLGSWFLDVTAGAPITVDHYSTVLS